jgi:hypothetical protein
MRLIGTGSYFIDQAAYFRSQTRQHDEPCAGAVRPAPDPPTHQRACHGEAIAVSLATQL